MEYIIQDKHGYWQEISASSPEEAVRLSSNLSEKEIIMTLTTNEAADRLGVTDSRIRQLILRGILPAEKRAGAWFVNELDLKMVVDRRKPGRPRKGE